MNPKSTFHKFMAHLSKKIAEKKGLIIVMFLLTGACAFIAIRYGLKDLVQTKAKQEQSAPITDDAKDKAYNKTREIVQLVETNDIDKIISSFDRNTRQALPAEKLLAMWDRAQRQFGTFQGFEDDTKVMEKGGSLMTETTVKFEKINLCLQLTFDKNGQIGGFFIKPILF